MCDFLLTKLLTFNFWFFRIEEPPVLGIEKTLKELRIFMKCPTNNRQLYRWLFDQFLNFSETTIMYQNKFFDFWNHDYIYYIILYYIIHKIVDHRVQFLVSVQH
jgi:hypothetical protein